MKQLSFILIFVLAIITSSCLDMVEEITLNRDGSGSYSMSIDMSEMMTMMKGLMSSEEENNETNFSGSMDSTMQELAATLRDMQGISNVAHQTENFKFKISYDFADIEALNEAAQNNALSSGGMGQGEMMDGMMPTNPAYEWTKKTFERIDPPTEDLLDQASSEDDEMAQAMEMAKMFMGSASYKSIYHFPGKIKKMENDDARISADKKTATLEVKLLDILEGNAGLGNKIYYKKK
jgi:hypothetical protein